MHWHCLNISIFTAWSRTLRLPSDSIHSEHLFWLRPSPIRENIPSENNDGDWLCECFHAYTLNIVLTDNWWMLTCRCQDGESQSILNICRRTEQITFRAGECNQLRSHSKTVFQCPAIYLKMYPKYSFQQLKKLKRLRQNETAFRKKKKNHLFTSLHLNAFNQILNYLLSSTSAAGVKNDRGSWSYVSIVLVAWHTQHTCRFDLSLAVTSIYQNNYLPLAECQAFAEKFLTCE